MNQKQKQVLQLQKKARQRKKDHAFIIEGNKLFEEAPKDRIRYTVVSESFLLDPANRSLVKGMEYDVVNDSVFADLSDTRTPQGILAVLEQFEYKLEELLPKDRPPFLLVLETIQDPGNLGTMLRAGEAAGVTGVILNDTSVDIYNPKVVRSTMGAMYRVPFYISESLSETLDVLAEADVAVYAAHLKGEKSYDQMDYTKGSAFLIGNEANGLSEELAQKAGNYIKIPMEGEVESLNAAMAATVLLFEAARQRRK